MAKKKLQSIFASHIRNRRKIVLLRGMLVVAVGGLLVQAGAETVGFGALALVLAFAASDVLLLWAPANLFSSLKLEMTVGAVDLVLVALGIRLAGAHSGALPVSCLLMVMVVALGNYTARTVAGAVTVGALHAWMFIGPESAAASAGSLALQIVFLCTIALYYGALVHRIHRSRRREEAQSMSRRELSALLEILRSVTSSIDVRSVTQTIVRYIDDVVPSMRCSLIFLEPANKRCFVMASHDDPSIDMLEIDLEKYPEIRKAIETRAPVLIRDVGTDPIVSDVSQLLLGLGVTSLMVLPLTFADEVLGTLLLRTARADESFNADEINFCRAVADVSANALKNALLHRQVEEGSARHQSTLEQLGSVLRHSPDLILTTDTEGRITEFNHGGETLLGYDRADLLGGSFKLLFEHQRHDDLLDKIRAAGVLSNYSCSMKKKDGTELDMQLNMSLLRDAADRITGTVWIARDVTELRTAQQQLVQAEKLSAIGNVISGVAHELNNPLSVVLGFSQLLLARDGNRQVEHIQEAAQRCQKIVKNLLSFARAHKPERKYLGANGIIEKTIDLKQYQLHVDNIEIVRELDPELPLTMLDFNQIQQVLLNLVNNAQHAMARTDNRPRTLTVRSRRSERGIRLEIADTGEGMPAETLERIFDPFFTTKPPGRGTGLGLSVSYGIIAEHGGQIQAYSKVGQGTTFVIDLPVHREERFAEATDGSVEKLEQRSEVKAPEQRTILLVDDEQPVLELMIDILQELGHRIDTASNGEEAWRKVRDHDYDLVLTDVRMPRMNGIELYRNLLEIKPEMKNRVIFSTGDLIDSETAGFVAKINARTIAKPFDIGQMVRVIEEALADGVPAA
jgi:two-component system NtrC family sensor kinase